MATEYKPRRFDQSPLLRVVYNHFGDFREAHHRDFSDRLEMARALARRRVSGGPPRKQFERYRPDPNEVVYAIADDDETTAGFDQTRPDNDADFNQDPGW